MGEGLIKAGLEYWAPINKAVEKLRQDGFTLSEASCAAFFRYGFPEHFGEIRYLLLKGVTPRQLGETARANGASELVAGMQEAAACFEHRSFL